MSELPGRQEAQAQAILTVLQVRGIDVPEEARRSILTQQDPARPAQWLARAAVATSLADVIDLPS